jgi:pyrophosphate--fructose-6-phosphate 1-phosphotransferase
MAKDVSPLEAARAAYEPRVPPVLGAGMAVAFEEGEPTTSIADEEAIRAAFPRGYGRPVLEARPAGGRTEARPLRVGVVLSGGQAPGGHNVITGLHDALVSARPGSTLLGFQGGPRGILEARQRELGGAEIDAHRNTGGFDLIGSGRDKVETAAQLDRCREVCGQLGLTGLVIVGGDDSNTNAALLAEHFLERGVGTAVVGVPKTIDGDLKGGRVETSFGFDTATKVYSELVGNICRDARSAAKYWHFIKLMGRSASHVTLECALQTRPNLTLIGEEIRERGLTLEQVVEQIADVVRRRAATGRGYGVCLVPEGLIEFVPEIGRLIATLNRMLSERSAEFERLAGPDAQVGFARAGLDSAEARVLDTLPAELRVQLLQERDAHGNVQVSKIDTEVLLIRKVSERLRDSGFGGKLAVQGHFFGYEGRCAAPSDFDASYTYGLGRLAAALVAAGKTGYLCALGNLAAPPDRWTAAGVPLTSLMRLETRKGRAVPVVAKALVDLGGAPFRALAAAREGWAVEDAYRYPGPIQYFGPQEVTGAITETLRLERPGA